MKSVLFRWMFAAATALSTAFVSAKDDLPYTEGAVTEVTYVKTKAGRFNDYMEFLSKDWKTMNTELKAAGVIVDFHIYGAAPRNPSEPDLILCVTYKNMAALDNLDEKSAPVMEKLVGTRKKADEAAIGREPIREILGSELIRELVLK